jgi:hypothetical protein
MRILSASFALTTFARPPGIAIRGHWRAVSQNGTARNRLRLTSGILQDARLAASASIMFFLAALQTLLGPLRRLVILGDPEHDLLGFLIIQ